MPRGSKENHTEKQKRQAKHIVQGYKKQGRSEEQAERIAWATVNKADRGDKKIDRAKTPDNPKPNKRSGRKGGSILR